MKTLLFLLQKEFRQIFRNKTILALILVMPSMQLIILPLAANYEVRNIQIAVVDQDHSTWSRQLTQNILASGYFRLAGKTEKYAEAEKWVERDQADLILSIPAGFERQLVREEKAGLFVSVNAINGVKANLGGAYLGQIIARFNQQIRVKIQAYDRFSPLPALDIRYSNWYNPYQQYPRYMVPGILAILVTMIGGFLTALNIVAEKEAGTMEQINVSPIRKHHFVLGKLIPFWVLGNVVFTIGLLLARVVYGIVPEGSLLPLYGFIWVYLLAVLGLGLWVSTFCETQQQAMFIMFFFVMIFVLMGGLFTPVESMPEWAQWISRINPARYLIQVIRQIVLKGSGWAEIRPALLKITGFAVFFNTIAILNYQKQSK